MITFFVCLAILLLGYRYYSKIAERIFGADDKRATPAVKEGDGVDYVPLPLWKTFLIQFLNIAGLGPIFGAIAGAMWGPVAFVWITLGSIFAGSVHDYFGAMLSLKHQGQSISEVAGHYLGSLAKQFMRVFTVLLLIMVGAVFILGPAKILSSMGAGSVNLWLAIIICYYILSTILPIDKVIGRFYPIFGLALLVMAVGLIGGLFVKGIPIPELTLASFANVHDQPSSFPIFPMLFITIACGAISGFHATQSPIMARCIRKESQGRSVFFGAMITEGIVALIWAAISMSCFGGVRELNDLMVSNNYNAAYAVNLISSTLMGKIGAILAVLGVVAAPITSGDTAFRSARIIVADSLKVLQKPILNRLYISIPLFVIGVGLTFLNFGVVWRYFAWTNQTLATIVLWTVTVYLIRHGKTFWIALSPACFMTTVVVSYILIAPEGFQLPYIPSVIAGILVTLSILVTLYLARNKKTMALQNV